MILTMDGLKIRNERIRRGLTLKKLDELSGVTFVTISNIETGKTSPTPLTLGKLATALGLPPDFFIT